MLCPFPPVTKEGARGPSALCCHVKARLVTAVAARVHHSEGLLSPEMILLGSVITLSGGNFIFSQLFSFFTIIYLSVLGLHRSASCGERGLFSSRCWSVFHLP